MIRTLLDHKYVNYLNPSLSLSQAKGAHTKCNNKKNGVIQTTTTILAVAEDKLVVHLLKISIDLQKETYS